MLTFLICAGKKMILNTRRFTINFVLSSGRAEKNEKNQKKIKTYTNARKSKIKQKLMENAMGGRRQPRRFRGTKVPIITTRRKITTTI